MELEKKSSGAFVGLAVILIILVVGGIYIWMSNNTSLVAESPSSSTSAITNQDSAELNALEQDVDAADPNAGVDANAVN